VITISKEELITGTILNINKPLGWTSFDVVKYITAKYKCKAGHAGTLDPMATGVLIICTGNKTKEIQTIQESQKEYSATIHLGITRPSFDIETAVSEYIPTVNLNQTLIEESLNSLIGIQEQVAPLYSAKKINGQPVYQLARAGIKKELKPAKVELVQAFLENYQNVTLTANELNGISIHNFKKNTTAAENPCCTLNIKTAQVTEISVRLITSKGFYVRSFARDLALKLNTVGTLKSLVRLRVGHYILPNAISLH
jgi:tRNA pseudouridine55 synthase